MPVKVTVSPLQGLNTAPLTGKWTFTVTEAAALTATNSRAANRYGTSIFTLFIFPPFFWIRFLDQFRGRNILRSRRGSGGFFAGNLSASNRPVKVERAPEPAHSGPFPGGWRGFLAKTGVAVEKLLLSH